jgi:AcrR family transcriptional regulator
MAAPRINGSQDGSSRRRLPRADRKRQMVEVGRRLFAERGFGSVTMEELAAAVGITKPLLYAYFGNKEQFYLACMAPAGDALVEAVVEAVRAAGSPGRALRRGLEAFFQVLDEDRAAWRVLFDETLPSSGPVAQQVALYRERLAGLVEGELLAQLGGRVSEEQREEVRALAAATFGAAEGLCRWWLREGRMEAQRAAHLLGTVLGDGLRGLAAREAADG